MADKLEALAKAMLAAWRATNPNAPMWANPEDWYGLMDTLAEAALRFLGCVNSKGEVVVPGEGAIGRLIAFHGRMVAGELVLCDDAQEILAAVKGETG